MNRHTDAEPADEDPGQRTRSEQVRIVEFEDRHLAEFRALQVQWLTEAGFEIEPEDEHQISDPRAAILDRGGRILVALLGDTLVGSCATIPNHPGELEIAKFGVDQKIQGRGVGHRLLAKTIEDARRAGYRRLSLVSHSRLEAALHLYRRFEFREVPLPADSPYRAIDLAMVLDL